jgi:tetratricopeptide (TPR) repeat protein
MMTEIVFHFHCHFNIAKSISKETNELMMEDLRSLVRRSITEKIIDPDKDLTEDKRSVRDYLSKEDLSKLKFKLEVAVPIHLPPKSGKGTCRRVVDLVENEFQRFGGGAQITSCRGSWLDERGNSIVESCVMVSTTASLEKWYSSPPMLHSIIHSIQELLFQQCVFVAVDGLPYGDPIDVVKKPYSFYPGIEDFQEIDPLCVEMLNHTYDHDFLSSIQEPSVSRVPSIPYEERNLSKSDLQEITSNVISILNDAGITGKEEVSNLSTNLVQDLDETVATAVNLSNYGIEFDPWDELKLCEASLISGRIKSAEHYAENLIKIFTRNNDNEGQVYSMRLLTRIYHRQGRSVEAQKIAEKCLVICRENSLKLELAMTLGNLAILESYFGNKELSERLMTDVLRRMTSLGNQNGIARSNLNLGQHFRALGDIKTAEKHLLLGKSISESEGDAKTLVSILTSLAGICESSGNRKKAFDYLSKAVETCNEGDFGILELGVLSQLAHIHRRSGNTELAKSEILKILSKTRELGLPFQEASQLNSLAIIVRSEGDLRYAECLLNESASISERINNIIGIGRSKQILGDVYQARGDYKKAMQCYDSSLEIHQARKYSSGIAYVKGEQSKIYLAQGKIDASMDLIEQSISISRQRGDKGAESYYLNVKGDIHESRGDYDNAQYFYEQSLDCARQTETPLLEAEPLRLMGLISETRGDIESAEDLFLSAQRIYLKVGNKEGEAKVLVDLGRLFDLRGMPQEAKVNYEKSLQISEKCGFKLGQSDCLNNLAVLLFSQEKYLEAKELFKKSLDIDWEIGNLLGESYSLENIGTVEEELGNLTLAEELYQQSLQISRELNDIIGQANTLYLLGDLKSRNNDQESLVEAEKYLTEGLELTNKSGDKSRGEKIRKVLNRLE